MVNFAKKWLRLASNDQFWSCFPSLPPKMRLRLTRNGQFHPIHNFPHLLPPKSLIFGEIKKNFIPWGGRVHQQIFEFFNFFESFYSEVAQNDPQWQILPAKWLRLAQNGQFWSFCMFFHLIPQNEAPIDSEWPISPDSQLSHIFPPKCLILGEISTIFVPWGYEVYQEIF